MKNLGLLALVGIGAFLLFKGSGEQITPLEKAWIERMKASPEWMAAEEQKALQNGLTIDEQLLLDARWMISEGWTL